jgi:hypothetical protein
MEGGKVEVGMPPSGFGIGKEVKTVLYSQSQPKIRRSKIDKRR